MSVITIDGQVGAGAPEIGLKVASILKYDYIDRVILANAAQRLGTSIDTLSEKESPPTNRIDRIMKFLQTLLERSAGAGSGGDPYFGPGLGILLGQTYPEATEEPHNKGEMLLDEHYIEALTGVIKDIGHTGNAVIIGRGSNIILKDHPHALHVGLVSSIEDRTTMICNREKLTEDLAKSYIHQHESARTVFMEKYFGSKTNDPSQFELILNTHTLGFDRSVEIITNTSGFAL